MTPDPVITLRGVSFSYDGSPVLENVDLAIPQRDFVCVIGPNGGGKTTLLKLILGLIEPQKGQVRVLGVAPAQARRRIGYMPQRAQLDPQFPVSVLDVILMGRLGTGPWVGPYRRADRAVARRVLEEVGLADAANRPFAALSGGQRQRVFIARALACEPQILLLDEPTANLDPAVQDDLYALLRDLKQRLTVVLVSHDVGFVSVFFETVVCVNRTVHTHPTLELTRQRVADVYGREVRLVHTGMAADTGATP
jgi:zinc transport system ATP-binding protein